MNVLKFIEPYTRKVTFTLQYFKKKKKKKHVEKQFTAFNFGLLKDL